MEPVENRFYVYVYLDPRKPGNYTYGVYQFDYEPFYVGKGSNGRSDVHLSGNEDNEHFDNVIKKIQRVCNTDPIIVKYQDMLLEQDSFDLEIKMIATIGRYDLKRGPLCNLTNGGEGSTGWICSDETKNKMSQSHIGVVGPAHHNYGKLHTDEHKKQTGVSVSEWWSNPENKKRMEHRVPWNKGKKGLQVGWNKGMKGPEPWNKGKINCFSKESLEKKSKSLKGRVPWNKGKKGSIPWNKGKIVNMSWIYSVVEKKSMIIKNNEIALYLQQGWIKGRKIIF